MGDRGLLADEGVYSVGRIFQKELKWIFRDQPKADHGIDAHVEICNNGNPTGQLVAVQIKSGESFFKESGEQGFIFRFGDWHYRYWLNHCLPVLVALYNPVDGLVFWQEINHETVESTGQGYKVIIPFENLLRHNSGIYISQASVAITGGYDRIDQVEYFRNSGVLHAEKVIAPLINCMRNAEIEILICAPYVDSDFLRLLCAISYSVRVKLITRQPLQSQTEDRDLYNKKRDRGLTIRSHPSLHARFVIIDNKFAFQSSMNFTQGAFDIKSKNMELIFPFTEKENVNELGETFSSIWEQGHA